MEERQKRPESPFETIDFIFQHGMLVTAIFLKHFA
jgi:hypothetical protein